MNNDPRTAPLIPVAISIDHHRPVFDIRIEEGVTRPYLPPMTTKVVIRGWERASGQIIEYTGTLAPDVVLRQEPPTPDDLDWLRAIGALEDAPPAKRHTLAEHARDVENWFLRRRVAISLGREERDRAFFVAYERWLADRVLLSEEDARGPYA